MEGVDWMIAIFKGMKIVVEGIMIIMYIFIYKIESDEITKTTREMEVFGKKKKPPQLSFSIKSQKRLLVPFVSSLHHLG